MKFMIYHISTPGEWDEIKLKEFYQPESFASEGFIHCSTLEKIEESANRFFLGKSEIVILCIDEKKVKDEIVYEDLYNSGYEFPHIYGKLNINSVIKVITAKSNNNGEFNIAELR